MQIIKLFVTLTIFVACAYAATGDSCINAHALDATLLNNGLVSANGYKDYTFSSATSTSPVAPATVSSYTFLSSIEGGNCAVSSPQRVFWVKWTPTQNAYVTLEMTTSDENTRVWDTKLVIYSIASTEPASNCSGLAVLSCEGNIQDMCQQYPVKAPTYKFFVGRTYYFMLHSEFSTAATITSFYLSFIKRTVLQPENFESNGDNLPNGWTFVSSSSYGGWRVSTPAVANGGDINFQNVDAASVGGIQTRALFMNPFKNGAITPAQCYNPANEGHCNQTINYVTTTSFDLTAFTDYELLFDSYFFNGYTGSQQTIRIIGDVLASTDNGVTFDLIYTMPNISATFNKYVTQRVPLHDYVGENVIFRFFYHALITPPNFGWAIDNIGIVPKVDTDMCDDGLNCTYHTCSIGGSDSTPKGCKTNANNTFCQVQTVSCVNAVCGAGPAVDGGCVFTNVDSNCNDGLSCTTDTCNTHANKNALTGCYNDEDNTKCNDNKGCTLDKCANSLNPLSSENIWDGPVADGGSGTGCIFIPDCDDGVKCTDDSCEKAYNLEEKCLHTINLQLCDDNIDCTYELTCDPEQPGYDKLISGCIRVPMNEWCDDNDPCTIDTCEPSLNQTNSCVNTNVTCDDCLQCTFDYCVDGACEHEPIHDMCDDHFDCTVDICDESLGKCTNNPNDTYCEYFGEDLCNLHYCRPWASTDGSGCVAIPKVCSDDIACSEDYCDPTTGDCFFEANDTRCDDSLSCTDDVCSLELGKCTNKPNSTHCDDGDSCTVDYCSMTGVCEAYDIDCTDEVVCSDDSCQDGECVHSYNNTNCDDGFDCTVDVCDESLGKCTNNPDDSYCAGIINPCMISFCNVESSADSTGCYFVEKDCSDAITCTYDYCDEDTGLCHHIANNSFCDDGHECTEDICDIGLGKCTNFADNLRCEDGNGCTERDICGDDGECHYVDKYCNDQIYCTVDFCDPNSVELCQHVANDSLCDDGNDCTDDYCSVDLGRCVNIPMDSWCQNKSECQTGVCSLEAGQCVYESHDDLCDDLVGCTIDVCAGAEGCVRISRDSLCNDGLGCTEDICNGTGCQYIPHDNWCEDGLSCTEKVCSTTDDCIVTFVDSLCDDNINCTEDICTAEGCKNTEMDSWCSDGIGCTVDICNKNAADGLYCSNEGNDTLCEDGFSCSSHTCDLDAGCVANFTGCPWYDRTLDDKICIECMSSSGQIVQNHYEDGTGAMHFSTLDANSGLQDRMVLTPTNNVIIGGDRDSIPVHKDDGLVVGTNMRIVPQEAGFVPPLCNEIRRGTIIVVQESYPCGEDQCHRDVVQVCVLDSTYHYQTLSTQPAESL